MNPGENGALSPLPVLEYESNPIDGNTIRRLVVASSDIYSQKQDRGQKYIELPTLSFEVIPVSQEPEGEALQLKCGGGDLASGQWYGRTDAISTDEVVASYTDCFSFVEEGGGRKGLRLPQIGAVYAVMAHMTSSIEPATVVMPTGTGKTETMLSLYCKMRPQRLLVVVPTDPLRDQIASKFETLGKLRQFGIVDQKALRPYVGKIKHGFSSSVGVRGFAEGSNVIVATPNALMRTSEELREELLSQCSHVFFDEAHHIGAHTWRQLRDEFAGKPTVQFTATPYRSDGIQIGGKIVYNFPLRRAQEQGYFSKIKYIGVIDYDDEDGAIARQAVACLQEDLEHGLDHILMARVRTKKRAEAVYEIYKKIAPELNPVLLYSGLRSRQRKTVFDALSENGGTRASRIVVCVDMMGEGVDMPSLKVAAIHDSHKTLGITLQFVGRFARSGDERLGDATVVVNRGDPQHDKRLKELYAESSDWNDIIQNLSADAVEEQENLGVFADGFGGTLPDDVSLNNLSPKMSTVVYRTQATTWSPERLKEVFGDKLVTNPLPINHNENVVWLVAKIATAPGWGDIKALENTEYIFMALYWDKEKQLLYINNSSNDGVYEDIAKRVCGESVQLIKGINVYRSLSAVNRRVPTNVGLKDILNKSFELVVSPNTDEIFAADDHATKTKTNIFVRGFDDASGERVTVGASVKGRVWSYKKAFSLRQWMDWCRYVGAKLTDDAIDVAEVIGEFIIPETIHERPNLMPLALEWASESYLSVNENITVKYEDEECCILDTELSIVSFAKEGGIPFTLTLPSGKAINYILTIANGKMTVKPEGNDARVNERGVQIPFSEYVSSQGLRVIFEQEIILEPDMQLYKPKSISPAFDTNKLEVIDWDGDGVDIRRESQGQNRDQSTIQARATKYVETLAEWDVIVDDDGSGEMADIVAMKIEGQQLLVNLVHCKFSHGDRPGARVIDLYEVCGQAQKSVARRRKYEAFVTNLVRRERHRRASGKNGLLKGEPSNLHKILEKAPALLPSFTITIVQPGVSKSQISKEQLELLAATESYIRHTGGPTPLRVVVSA